MLDVRLHARTLGVVEVEFSLAYGEIHAARGAKKSVDERTSTSRLSHVALSVRFGSIADIGTRLNERRLTDVRCSKAVRQLATSLPVKADASLARFVVLAGT
jgi:hypothetical protein